MTKLLASAGALALVLGLSGTALAAPVVCPPGDFGFTGGPPGGFISTAAHALRLGGSGKDGAPGQVVKEVAQDEGSDPGAGDAVQAGLAQCGVGSEAS